jgi:hypothetical protein
VKAWSHLPNAHHIDWVLASLKENPESWAAARVAAWTTAMTAARSAAWDAAISAARDAAWAAAWDAARDAARDADWGAIWSAARGVISALVAYDDCDQFLSMSYERLKVWAVLSEDPRAILLLPMVRVKEKLNEQCLVTSA